MDEMASRFNDRGNLYLFRDPLPELPGAPVLEDKELIVA